jgi:altronate dehydratase
MTQDKEKDCCVTAAGEARNTRNAVVLSEEDNVAVVLCELKPGDTAAYICSGCICTVKALETIPVYHKISTAFIREGSAVYKYGVSIGKAVTDIEPGSHVHSHNLISIREYIV